MTQPSFDSEINLQLRSAYRKEIHKIWTSGTKNFGSANKIKHELLENESNSSKKFYRYRSFVDWDEARLNSEVEDIENNKIALTAASNLNDPYDCRAPLWIVRNFLTKLMSDENQFRRQAEIRKLSRTNPIKLPTWQNKKLERALY